jgi:RimJ/RimL family protein N-acetyltransferase
MVLSLDPVVTPRLTLPLWSAADAAAIRGLAPRPSGWHPDFPRRDDVDAASMWREGDVWGPRSIVRGVTTLGSIGFFGPPEESGEVEVGYGLVREAWGWGFATEALQAVLAALEPGIVVRASVAPDNARSIRVLAKCGFTELRGANEDGELVMARPATPVADTV